MCSVVTEAGGLGGMVLQAGQQPLCRANADKQSDCGWGDLL